MLVIAVLLSLCSDAYKYCYLSLLSFLLFAAKLALQVLYMLWQIRLSVHPLRSGIVSNEVTQMDVVFTIG